MNERTQPMGKSNTVAIIADNEGVKLDDALWAINWFDLKSKRLYNFYNLLAFPHVKKVGGAPFFKGYVKEQLAGEAKYDRQVLLIVRYPSADAFLQMLKSRLFLLKRVVRIRSVSKFIFGFMQPIIHNPQPLDKPARYDGGRGYLAVQLRSEVDAGDAISQFVGDLDSSQLQLYFAGRKAAVIARRDRERDRIQPFFMDNLVMLESDSEEALRQVLKSGHFEQLKSQCPSINAYLIKRVI